MLVVSGVVGHSSDPLVEHQASAIAQAYLEEALLANFCDPDVLSGTQTCRQRCVAPACGSAACGGGAAFREARRDLYDNVCDYAGLDDAGARDRNGNPLPGLDAYRVQVAVEDSGVSLGAPAISGNAGAVVRVVVTVSHAALAQAITLAAMRTNTQ